MLSSEDAKILIAFLNRSEIKGHGERELMNELIKKLTTMSEENSGD